MIKTLVKAHFLKCRQRTHGVHPSHTAPLDHQADRVGSGMPSAFLGKEVPGLMSSVALRLRGVGHYDRLIRLITELKWEKSIT
jgi:hypothetical protein